MHKFLFIYYGWKIPQTPEEGKQKMKLWQDWFESLGEKLTSMGGTFSKPVIVDKNEVTEGEHSKAGYSFIEAESLEKAIAAAKSCPIYEDGGKIEVIQIERMG